MRVAVIHEWFELLGGSERVVEQILACHPEAALYALVDFMPDATREFLLGRPVHTSFLQRLPFAKKRFRNYLALMPLAVEQFDLTGYDVIISSSHAVAKGVLTRCDQMHVSYVHTPVRYAWDLQHEYLTQRKLTRGLRSAVVRAILHYIRLWDRASADRVDLFVTNSKYVARRVKATYSRPSVVIYPPVNIDAFPLKTEKEDYYVTASRMVPYKRVDLIVQAFNGMPHRKLVVIGDGPEYRKVASLAGPNVQILGSQPLEVLRRHFQSAKGFIFAADEDFGITPVEANACGTPVIAYGVGGATETVIEGKNGVFFNEQTPESIQEAVDRFEKQQNAFDPVAISAGADRFRPERFRHELDSLVKAAWERFRTGQPVETLAGNADSFAPAMKH